MAVTPMNPSMSLPALYTNGYQRPAGGQKGPASVQTPDKGGAGMQAVMTAEYYRSENLYIEFESKDGDTVRLGVEQVEYQKQVAAIDVQGKDLEKWEKIVGKAFDEFLTQQKNLLHAFMKSLGMEPGEEAEETSEAQEDELLVPAYWNAENTSQRIVDFALAFAGNFEGGDEEFIQIIKNAVEEGFAQAKEALGAVSDEVAALTADTHDLVMQKFDEWLAGKQEESSVPEEVAV